MATASSNGRAHTGGVTDDDIDPAARPTRRSFTAEYKAALREAYPRRPWGTVFPFTRTFCVARRPID